MNEWMNKLNDRIDFIQFQRKKWIRQNNYCGNITPQMLLIELNLSWTQNISLKLVITQE